LGSAYFAQPRAFRHRERSDAKGGCTHAYGYVKKAAAIVNTRAGRLPAWKGDPIERVREVIAGEVGDEVIAGELDADFSL